MVTLKDIAARCQVNPATVSRALRGHTNVDPQTAERVQCCARELGYRANPRISGLMSLVRSGGRGVFHETLALVWVDAAAAFVRGVHHLAQFEQGTADRAEQLGYRLDVFHPREQRHSPAGLRRTLLARGIRGIVFGPALRSSRYHLRLPLDEFAVAAIGEAFVAPRLPHARFDLFVGMREALHRLKRRGCRRPGLVIDIAANRRALPALTASFIACGGAAGHALPRILARGALDPAEVRRWAARQRLDALLLSNDMEAFAPPFALGRTGTALPVFSLNRLRPDSIFAGIDQQQALIGANACDLVIAQLARHEKGVPSHSRTLLNEGEWREAAVVARAS